jgi:hypothetical protein
MAVVVYEVHSFAENPLFPLQLVPHCPLLRALLLVHKPSKGKGPAHPEGYPGPQPLTSRRWARKKSRFPPGPPGAERRVRTPSAPAAAAAVGRFPLFAVLVLVSDEHLVIYAGVGALEAGVVCLYGIGMVLGGWVRVLHYSHGRHPP